eukprot:CAMPEP_0185599776 /NCGR_PEP_ID=MMETSP0434-20130131/82935_1 /TAXON_ID=626734 ORGANISM="Favella taraikaensis, Strain Fe Narragansett Bay" /NCGR_SAMPLE_ID=MMETSP0434 /ASSEMBLY_ACC=CAM_ASM_000379 /LENGTH=62 /DNA_ID=CAMNT_0028229295 /DNA_START=784 /DNA_END=973 /DNA_ORIENTATION=+
MTLSLTAPPPPVTEVAPEASTAAVAELDVLASHRVASDDGGVCGGGDDDEHASRDGDGAQLC